MSWQILSTFADTAADLATLAILYWLYRIEVRLNRLEVSDSLMGRLLAEQPGRIPELLGDLKGTKK